MQIQYIRGFNLLEILVAFAIAAMSLGVIFDLFSTSASSTVLGKEYLHAVELAQSLVSEHGHSIDRVSNSGLSQERYRWRVTVTPNASGAETGPLDLRHLSVEVTWRSRGRDRTVKLEALKPNPFGAQ